MATHERRVKFYSNNELGFSLASNRIKSVKQGSQAAKKGVQQNQRITKINGNEANSANVKMLLKQTNDNYNQFFIVFNGQTQASEIINISVNDAMRTPYKVVKREMDNYLDTRQQLEGTIGRKRPKKRSRRIMAEYLSNAMQINGDI